MAADTQQQAAAQAANGKPPAPGETPCEDCATPSERVMGAVGLVFAVGLAAIAIDLITGGWLSRLAASVLGRDDGGNASAG